MRILVIGSGGREHAIAWSLSQSAHHPALFIAPGNGGTQSLGTNIDLDVTSHDDVVSFVKNNQVDFVIVGPEQPLVDGLTDALRGADIPVVGPSAAAARLEGSKAFSKAFMEKYEIPTAAFQTFEKHQLSEALHFVQEEGAPIVVKASGLAAGKGAIVCEMLGDAERAVRDLMEDEMLGEAGRTVVVESFMEGEEASIFVLTDGVNYSLLAPAQDHKRIGEGDRGPNTGGMGAYAPAPVITPGLLQEIKSDIIEPTLQGMVEEGCPYQGILYVGLMITSTGPKVVEYNCRLGDPETQVVLPLMDADAVDVFYALAEGRLDEVEIRTHSGASACVVLASEGYPGSYPKGMVISGLDVELDARTTIFHAGTKREDGQVVTTGGRVLAVSASGDSLQDALDHAYAGVDAIQFSGMQFRKDIGQKGLVRTD